MIAYCWIKSSLKRPRLGRAREIPDESFALEVSENPVTTGEQGYLCLVRIKEYFRFISDSKSQLRFALFEGNVRDYMGDTEVNEEIHATLASGEPGWQVHIEACGGPDGWHPIP